MARSEKFAAGDRVLYSSTGLHDVTPVTRGVVELLLAQGLRRRDTKRYLW